MGIVSTISNLLTPNKVHKFYDYQDGSAAVLVGLIDPSGNFNANFKVDLATALAGEDLVNQRMATESLALEQAFPLPGGGATLNPTTVVVDCGTITPASARKTIYVVVSVAITQPTGQATFQPYVSRAVVPAAAAATTSLGANQILLGAAVNFGPNGTTIAAGLYRLTIATTADLQYPDAQLGLRFNFPGAPTLGTLAAFCESAP